MSVPKPPPKNVVQISKKKPFLPDLPDTQKAAIQPCLYDPNTGEIVKTSLDGRVGKRMSRKQFEDQPNGHWQFPEQMFTGKNIGFIYVIRSKLDGSLYLGKKNYIGFGKANRGVESNWKWYTSSSKLADQIKLNGIEHYDFICIEEYTTKGALAYAETWSLCHVDALVVETPWLNKLIQKVSWSVKEKPTERHKARLAEICNL